MKTLNIVKMKKMDKNKPQIKAVLSILLLQIFVIPISCSNIKQTGIAQGQSMFMSVNGDDLFISSVNTIYHLDSNTLDTKAIAAFAGDVSDQTLGLVVHKDQGTEAVVTCGLHEQCFVRDIGNIIKITETFHIVENRGNTTGIFVEINGKNNFFYGIRDYRDQNEYHGGGLYKNTKPLVRFKSNYDPSSVSVTERYVGAFAWEDLLWFFSIRKTPGGRAYTKIAQIHQKNGDPETERSYIDMNITCGDFDELLNVKKAEIGKNVLILVATFTDSERGGSAVCVFNPTQIIEKFIDNYVECAKGTASREDFYRYLVNTPANTPCTVPFPGITREQFRDFSYNTDILDIFYVIGTLPLSLQPAVRIPRREVTALTLMRLDKGFVAFLGTANGHIFKVPIYPDSGNGVDIDKPFWQDEFKQKIAALESAKNGDSIFALTTSRVVKIPVQEHDRSLAQRKTILTTYFCEICFFLCIFLF